MPFNRRKFLTNIASAAAVGAFGKNAGLEQCIEILETSASPVDVQKEAIIKLLERRHAFFYGAAVKKPPYADRQSNLDNVEGFFHDNLSILDEKEIAMREQYLNPVGQNMNLLTHEEKKALKNELSELKDGISARLKGMYQELNTIDEALRNKQDLLLETIRPHQECSKSAHSSDKQNQVGQSSGEALLENVASAIIDDAISIASGKKPRFSTKFQRRDEAFELRINKLLEELNRVIAHSEQRAMRNADEEWDKQINAKRKNCRINYIRETLLKMAESPLISIESSLSKGYGEDNWTIASRMHKDEIGDEVDMQLSKSFESLMRDIPIAYPNRFTPNCSAHLKHARPLQPGYGNHDCERLTINNPEFSLREILKEAEIVNLKAHESLEAYFQPIKAASLQK